MEVLTVNIFPVLDLMESEQDLLHLSTHADVTTR